MKKLIISFALILFAIFSLFSCGGADVEIVIPSELAKLVNISDYSIADSGGYKDRTENEDGSITYVLTASQHKKLMEEADEKAKEFYDDIENSDNYPNITKVKTNSDYSEITITTKSEELDFQERLLNVTITMQSGVYSMFEGKPDKELKVEFVNADSGDVIFSKTSKADETGETETTTTVTTTTTTTTTTPVTTQAKTEVKTQTIEYKGFSIEVPDYYSKYSDDGENVMYVYGDGDTPIGSIIISVTKRSFTSSNIKDVAKSIFSEEGLDEIYFDENGHIQCRNYENKEINGKPAVSTYINKDIEDMKFGVIYTLIFDESQQVVYSLLRSKNDATITTHKEDWNKCLDSIKISTQ